MLKCSSLKVGTFIIGFKTNAENHYLHRFFTEIEVVKTLSTSVLDQQMLFFWKIIIIIIDQSSITIVVQEVIFLIIIVIQEMLSNQSCIISNIES